jgi:CrcB protein
VNVGGYAVWSLLGAIAAGSVGALLRWVSVSWLHGVLSRRTADPDPFPLGVLLANTGASLVAGIAVPVVAVAGAQWRLVIVGGLCGGLSTMSTLAVDTVAMWQRGQRGSAVGNVAANVVLGLTAALIGAHGVGPVLAGAFNR